MVQRSRSSYAATIYTGALFAALLCVQVRGHGYMSFPASRNWLGRNSNPVITYTPNGGNGRGVCGDPFEGGGEAFATMAWGRLGTARTFQPGQRVTMKIFITANHGGRFAFQICDRTSNLDQACFNRFLTRADVAGERYWWLFDTASNKEYTMDYVFPSDFSCPNGCVMRWEYVGTQTCVPPGCNRAVCGAYADGRNWGSQGGPGLCTAAEGLARTELFYNCADIRISGSSVNTCPTTCATPVNSCQTGGGCNTATRSCNPVTSVRNGTPCSGGACQNGACAVTPTGCSTTCATPTACQTGGGCNTATRSCNPITNRPNGTPCTGGTCQNGACAASPPRCTGTSTNGACGNGLCCTASNCCSSFGWCGASSSHCGTGCQAAWSGTGSVCNGVRVNSVARRRAAIAAARAAAANVTMSTAATAADTPADTTAVTSPTEPAPQPAAAISMETAASADPAEITDAAAVESTSLAAAAAAAAEDTAGVVVP